MDKNLSSLDELYSPAFLFLATLAAYTVSLVATGSREGLPLSALALLVAAACAALYLRVRMRRGGRRGGALAALWLTAWVLALAILLPLPVIHLTA